MRKSFLILMTTLLFVLPLGASSISLQYAGVIDKELLMDIPVKWSAVSMKDSSQGYDDNLAKASLVLARSIYVEPEILEANLNKLGYRHLMLTEEDNDVSAPVTAFGHQKHLGVNYYVIVVRGTASFEDMVTDLKAVSDYFEEAADRTFDSFEDYLAKVLKKKEKKAKGEKNRFLVVGHSLGGAVANLLSEMLMEYAEKDQIFTYTFESPSTGIEPEEAGETNAINIVNYNDFVPTLPLPMGRYGSDIGFWPEELDEEIYHSITGGELMDMVGFTIIHKWDNHLLDTSLTYVLSREQEKLVAVTEDGERLEDQ